MDAAYHQLNGAIRDRAREATTAISATTEALKDIVALYRRADGRG